MPMEREVWCSTLQRWMHWKQYDWHRPQRQNLHARNLQLEVPRWSNKSLFNIWTGKKWNRKAWTLLLSRWRLHNKQWCSIWYLEVNSKIPLKSCRCLYTQNRTLLEHRNKNCLWCQKDHRYVLIAFGSMMDTDGSMLESKTQMKPWFSDTFRPHLFNTHTNLVVKSVLITWNVLTLSS